MIGMYNNRDGAPRNDPKLFAPVKIKCLRPFFVKGRALKVGETATVEAHLARDMVAIGKAEIV